MAPTAAAAAAALIKVVTAVQRLVFVHCSQRVAPRAKASEQSYANIFSYCCEHIQRNAFAGHLCCCQTVVQPHTIAVRLHCAVVVKRGFEADAREVQAFLYYSSSPHTICIYFFLLLHFLSTITIIQWSDQSRRMTPCLLAWLEAVAHPSVPANCKSSQQTLFCFYEIIFIIIIIIVSSFSLPTLPLTSYL